MASNKTKLATLAIAIFFAILQVLQPFIHAHLDVDHSIHDKGFHVGIEHEESFSVSHNHSASFVPHASHIVSVTLAIKQDIDPALVVDVIDFVLFALFFVIALQSIRAPTPQPVLVSYKSLSWRLPASRAPPQF